MKIEYGIARRCINPAVPVSLAGYFNIRMWDRVLDDLEVRAVVFKQGPAYAALLHFDLVTVPLYLCDQILDGIRQAGITEITRKNLTISAIHTHTGPEVRFGRGGFICRLGYSGFLRTGIYRQRHGAHAKGKAQHEAHRCKEENRKWG